MSESLDPKTIRKPGSPDPNARIENKELILDSAFRTEQSKNHKTNQDRVLLVPQNGLFAVFDGVGGKPAGEVASRIACEEILEYFKQCNTGKGVTLEEIKDMISGALLFANHAILGNIQGNPGRKEMATTATVVKIYTDNEGETWGVVGYVGNSRLYLLDDDGFQQITVDDDAIAEAQEGGSINKESADKIREKIDNAENEGGLGEDGVALSYWNSKNQISKALGWNGSPTIKVFRIKKGSKIVITCDGINDNLVMARIEQIILENQTAGEIASGLLGEAVKVSKSRTFRSHEDDMSVVAVVCK